MNDSDDEYEEEEYYSFGGNLLKPGSPYSFGGNLLKPGSP
jgi:hypothetical protein